jgi:lipopolysaccharide/colanic/teichoic acid biosynthesis glycosyltransferase
LILSQLAKLEKEKIMNKYIILVSGPIASRNKSFAENIIAGLKDESAGSADTVAKEPMYIRKPADAETVTTATQQLAQYYFVIFGDNLLSLDTLRNSASLSLYVQASELDLTIDLLKNYGNTETATNLESKQTASAAKQTYTRALSEDINHIISKQKNSTIESTQQEIAYADIVIQENETIDESVPGIIRYILRTDPKLANQRLSDNKRQNRIDQMLQQYQSKRRKFRKEKVKRTLWLMVIKTTLIFKRLVDILATLVALFLLSPPLLVISMIIKFTDGGSVFYVQTRIGKHGKPFPFPKFRSMVLNADKMKDNLLKEADRIGDITFKMKRDPRVTRIGRFIRRSSIDELPQLWCVLKGDMSLVGPRPPVPREVALYTQEDRRRLEVIPGLTGIWQVSGRAEIEFKQQVELDVLYIESHGFWLDILLMLKTIPAVFTGKGAY